VAIAGLSHIGPLLVGGVDLLRGLINRPHFLICHALLKLKPLLA
jgi:hypothetical protein